MLDVQYALAPPETLTEHDVLHMLTRKTAALLEYAAWAGATIGGAGRKETDYIAETLGKFASLCGTAFQLQDDLLGLTADESLLGKPVGSDIREGKRTLIVFRALEKLDKEGRRQVLATLGNEHVSAPDLATTLKVIQQSGALEDVRKLANSYIDQALYLLESVPESDYKSLLRSWASFVLARQH